MIVHVEAASGRVMLLPRPQATGAGGGGGGGGRTSFANVVTADPDSAGEGDMIFNSTEGALKIYVSGVWVTIGASSGDGHTDFDRLLESGGLRLLEDGSSVLTMEG